MKSGSREMLVYIPNGLSYNHLARVGYQTVDVSYFNLNESADFLQVVAGQRDPQRIFPSTPT